MKPFLYKKSFNIKRQKGLSLVEVMISVTISLFVMAGVVQLYANSNRTSATAESVSRLQENMRYTMAILGDDIARSGNMGCFSLPAADASAIRDTDVQVNGVSVLNKPVINYLANRFNTIVDPNNLGQQIIVDENNVPINNATTLDSSWNDFEHSFISGDDNNSTLDATVLNNTDTLIVKFVDASSAIPIVATPNATSLTLANANNLADGDIVIAGDCRQTYVFSLAGVPGADTTVTIASGLPHGIEASAQANLYAGRTGAHRYFIGGANCAAGTPQNCSLFRSSNGGVAQQLVSGVHNLQVQYSRAGVLTPLGLAQTVGGGGNNRLNVDSVRVTVSFNAVDLTQPNGVLTKTVARVFATRNRL